MMQFTRIRVQRGGRGEEKIPCCPAVSSNLHQEEGQRFSGGFLLQNCLGMLGGHTHIGSALLMIC